MSKLFTLAYVTSHPRLGTKLRFGNVDRTAILAKEGHDPIRYVKLSDTPIDKRTLGELIAAHPDFQDDLAQQAINEFLGKAPKTAAKANDTVADNVIDLEQQDNGTWADPNANEPQAAAEPTVKELPLLTKPNTKAKRKNKQAESA